MKYDRDRQQREKGQKRGRSPFLKTPEKEEEACNPTPADGAESMKTFDSKEAYLPPIGTAVIGAIGLELALAFGSSPCAK